MVRNKLHRPWLRKKSEVSEHRRRTRIRSQSTYLPKKPASTAERLYNFIYGRLVKGHSDFTGLIAYGIYKRKKIRFIEGVKTREGREPTDGEIKQFHFASHEHIKDYRAQAERLTETVFQATYEEYLEEAEDVARGELEERYKKISGSFWRNTVASAAGSFLVAIIIGIILLALIGLQEGWQSVVEKCYKLYSGAE